MQLPIKVKSQAVLHPGSTCMCSVIDTVDKLEELVLLWSRSCPRLNDPRCKLSEIYTGNMGMELSQHDNTNPKPCM